MLGLGVEHAFLQHILDVATPIPTPELTARIIETSRNTPVRNVYLDNGFEKARTRPGGEF